MNKSRNRDAAYGREGPSLDYAADTIRLPATVSERIRNLCASKEVKRA